MHLPDALRSLRYPDFRAFFGARTIAQVATWMHSVAQAWLVLSLTNQTQLLIVTQAAQACTALAVALLVATGIVTYWHVGFLALCAGLANTLFSVVQQSFVTETVSRDDVVNAVALSSAAFNGARIMGPAAAGLVISSVGVAPAFAVSGAGYLLAAVGVGAVGGALTLGTVVPRHPPLALLDVSAAAACSVLLALSLIENVWLTAVAMFLLGYAGVIAAAGCNTVLQLASSDQLRGRVMSLFTLIHGGCFPIAALLIGAASEHWSESTALIVWGAGGLAALAVLAVARRPRVIVTE